MTTISIRERGASVFKMDMMELGDLRLLILQAFNNGWDENDLLRELVQETKRQCPGVPMSKICVLLTRWYRDCIYKEFAKLRKEGAK